MNTIEIPVKPPRRFLPNDLKIDSWEKVEQYFRNLKERSIGSVADLEQWLLDWSEVDAVFNEDLAWRYIKMTCDTTDQGRVDSYNFFISQIEPRLAPYHNDFSKKLIECPFVRELDSDKYAIFLRTVRKNVKLFREENIPLMVEIATESQKYGSINALMTVTVNGEEMTLQKAATLLKSPDRGLREEVFMKMQQRRGQDEQALNDLLTRLIRLRHRVAVNAGFENFRDYKHAQLGRFDYTVQDCFDFHDSIAREIVPVVEEFDRARKKQLGLESLRPWDTEVDPSGKPALRPFSDARELIGKSIECFQRVSPYFAERLEIMDQMGYFDLDSRKGKAPGGYNYTLDEIGVPFIFMNSVGSQRDLVTMVHEGGHAVHSFLSRDLELTAFKSLTSEIAELASMAMELMSMEHWDVFYPEQDELRRARFEQLEKVLRGLSWIARVDKFQHWLYENPEHTVQQRNAYWMQLGAEFSSREVDWSGYTEAAARTWQAQLHIFEVPFYYIEYGFAQLGAIAVWRNYKRNASQAVENYSNALRLGYTRSIPEIYEAAGIRFGFSPDYVKELIGFVKSELNRLHS
ncbi:MAG: M3 family oligoendopeptidase [Bacteroidota bacterium]